MPTAQFKNEQVCGSMPLTLNKCFKLKRPKLSLKIQNSNNIGKLLKIILNY
jgi:hypothetical protein